MIFLMKFNTLSCLGGFYTFNAKRRFWHRIF